MHPVIEIIPSHNIDKIKWDACIGNSSNALIYATADYLDNMTDNWHGIVLNDYDCVMPVPWRKKLGIRYSYDVAFIQQLGWFSKDQTTDGSLLLKALFEFVKYGDYTFNFNNKLPGENIVTCHHNYILDLSPGYENIEKKFSADVRTNTRNAQKNNFEYTSCDLLQPVDLFIDLYQSKLKHISEDDYSKFKSLTIVLAKKGKVFARNVLSQSGELLSAILVFKESGRLYNIMNSTTVAGKKRDANYFLLTQLWKEFAGQDFTFDFEGSDVAGIQKFYKKFGAELQPYSRIYFNKLSFPLSMMNAPKPG
ncbi:MAG: hypothetical protein ABI921_02545 [Panacibacter sp.]